MRHSIEKSQVLSVRNIQAFRSDKSYTIMIPLQVGMLGANAPKMAKEKWNIQIPVMVVYPKKIRGGAHDIIALP